MSENMVNETYTLPPAAPFHNEGRTPAAWVMFGGVCIGLLVAVVGFVLQLWIMLIVGVVIIAAGLLVSLGLRRAGKGQPLEETKPRDWYADEH